MTASQFTPADGTKVYVFTSGDLAIEFFETHDTVLLSIVIDFIPSCKRFAPIFAGIAETLAASDPPIKCATISCGEGSDVDDLVRKIRIPRFPSVVLVKGPESFKVYDGILREREILNFLTLETLPLITHTYPLNLKTKTSLQSLRAKHPTIPIVAAFFPAASSSDPTKTTTTTTAIVTPTTNDEPEPGDGDGTGTGKPSTSNNKRSQFETVAKTFQDKYLFATTCDPSVLRFQSDISSETTSKPSKEEEEEEEEEEEGPSVAIYKPVPEFHSVLSASEWTDRESLEKFVRSAGEPLVVEFLPEVYVGYLSGSVPVLGYILVDSAADAETARAAILPLARKYPSRIQFGSAVGPTFERLVDEMLVKKWPVFILHELATNLKYHLDPSKPWQGGNLDVDEIAAFVDRFYAGALEPVMKSEPIPETQDSALIKVVGLTYKDIVLDDDRDVFVEYYIQECGPCHAIAPLLVKFAEANAAHERGSKLVTVATMNLEENDAMDSNIRGFPNIKLYRAGNKSEPVSYNCEQGHGLSKWAKFLKDNGTHGVDLGL